MTDFKDILIGSSEVFRGNQNTCKYVKPIQRQNYTKEQIAERLLQAGEKRAATMLRKKLRAIEQQLR